MRITKHVLFYQLLFSLFTSHCLGGIYQVTQELDQGGLLTIHEGIFAPQDAPVKATPGDGRSFIQVEAAVTVLDQSSKDSIGQVQVLVFHSDHLSNVRKQVENKYIFCCVDNSPYCSPGEAYLSTNKSDELQVFTFPLGNGSEVSISETVNVQKSGVWYFYVVDCREENVVFDGKVTFMNPYGYLPAELYPFLPFYGIMALMYIIMGLVWLIICLRFRKVILPLQIWIGVVIALAVIESATLYFDNLGYNNAGENWIAANVVGVLVSTLKRTVSRVLVLVVSLGYGVVRPTLGQTKYWVLLLAILYLIFSGALSVVDLVQKTATQSSLVMFLFLLLPVAFLDTAFYWWIFMSLLRTTHQLGVRKQTVKMQMYTYFLRTLVCFGVATAIFMLLQVIITSKDTTTQWRSYWIWTAGWHWLYFMILLAITILWRPTANNTRYAYTETGADPDDEVILHTFGEVQTRHTPLEVSISNEITLDPNASFSIDEDDLGTTGPGKME